MSKRKRTGEGFVYIVRVGEMHKIGCVAYSPESRFNVLAYATGQLVERVLVLETDKATGLERFLHEAFESKAVDPASVPGNPKCNASTEYFNLTTADIDAIPAMAESAGLIARPWSGDELEIGLTDGMF